MTEYELTYLFNETYSTAFTMISTHMALVSGTVIAAFTSAHLLSRNMIWLMLGLYSWMSFVLLNIEFRQMSIVSGLFEQIRVFSATGKGLSWHAAALTPASVSDAIPYFATGFGAIVYVATIVFIFQCRKLHLSGAPHVA